MAKLHDKKVSMAHKFYRQTGSRPGFSKFAKNGSGKGSEPHYAKPGHGRGGSLYKYGEQGSGEGSKPVYHQTASKDRGMKEGSSKSDQKGKASLESNRTKVGKRFTNQMNQGKNENNHATH